ncbi:MAG: LysM peptidoglycan-binding domain-containing protein [Terrimicrobiaceae bacterium]
MLPVLVALMAVPLAGFCQARPASFSRVEAGLEEAVKWKWEVEPTPESAWGMRVPDPVRVAAGEVPAQPEAAPDPSGTYVVKKGDALIKIARAHKITVDQLKTANGLTSNLIRIGDELRIPSVEEIAMMPAPAAKPTTGTPPASAPPVPNLPPGVDPNVLLFQVHLDRKDFSPGLINGKRSPHFEKLMYVYQLAHGGIMDEETLRERARREVGEVFKSYELRPEDFRFIAAPKRRHPAEDIPSSTTKKSKSPPQALPFTYDELLAQPFLTYHSPWELVAERFHCDEAFLRSINPTLPANPPAGTVFRVPNVEAYLIEERIYAQPPADPAKPVSAAIVDLARLEISEGGRLVAVFPIHSARPGLRGRGTWIIQDAIPRPQLTTLRESREAPRPVSSFYAGPSPTPGPMPTLAKREILAAGPNNPVGVVWINLAKSDDPAPLPFGLHGAGNPSQMETESSLGGFRLTNWDIIRAVRLLPQGTILTWRQSTTPTIAVPPR